MNIPFQNVLESNGYYAADYTSYETIRQTWDASRSKQATPLQLGMIRDLYYNAVMAGSMPGPYHWERQREYAKAGISLQEIDELVSEYNLAKSAGDETLAQVYQVKLQGLHAQRQAIKNQYPKP